MKEQTLFLIKPDLFKKNKLGQILFFLEKEGFVLKNIKQFLFSKEQLDIFYQEHCKKDWFQKEYSHYMMSGPVIAVVLEREQSIKYLRKCLGSTNPINAEVGTIRQLFGESIEKNGSHGSDSQESFEREYKVVFDD